MSARATLPGIGRAVLLAAAFLACHANRAHAAPGDTIFYDDLNGNLNAFTIVSGGGDASTGTETSNQGQSLRLRWNTVEIYTDPINATVPGAELSLWIRRGDDAFSENPEVGEDLVIEYRDGGGSWIVLDTYAGGDTPGEIFTPTYVLPAAARHANLSVRLRLVTGSGPDWDYWHVDDIMVTETAAGGAPLGIGSCDDFENGLGNWTINATGGNAGISSQTANSPVSSLYTRAGQVSVMSNVIDLSAESLVSLDIWVRRGANSFSNAPETGEDLALEYYSSGGSWIGLETFAGGGTQGEIFTRSYALPSAALHAGFRVKVRQTAGNGSTADVWHIDDVCLASIVPTSYSFEEDAWTGAPGEVVDGSGNGLNGTVFGGAINDATDPAIPTDPGTCRYAEFDGIDDYIEIPDDAALDIADELTVAAWINMRSMPAELHTIVSKDTNYEFHIDDQGRVYWWWSADNFRTNGFSLGLNQWHHVAITFRSGSQTIYVDGVSRATNNYVGTLPQNDLPVYIGTDWNFISRAFDGYIDEVYIVPLELSQAQVQTLMTQTHDCASAAAEFTINHDNFGINCVAETITVAAIDSTAGTPLLNYNAEVQLDTQNGNGSWTLLAGSGAFVDAVAGDGLATYDWPLGESQAIFALSYPQGPSVINDIDVFQVSDPGIRDTDAEGSLVFSANGFTLTAAPLSNPPAGPIVPFSTAQTAAFPFDVYIAAYGQTPDDPVCGIIEDYTGNKNLKFWSQYVDPGSGTLAVAIDGVPIPALEASAANQLVVFANGQAQVLAEYDDVGSKQIWVKDDATVNAELPAGIRGATADFVSRPASFELSGIQDGAGNGNPAAADANGLMFIGAGRPFEMTVTALDADGDPTPNYGRESMPEYVRLDIQLVAPAAGVSPGLGPAMGFGAFSNGVATGSSFFWDEVGIIQLTPAVGDGDYLGAGDVVGAISENIGRFVPDHFALSWTTPPMFATACSDGDFDGDGFGYEGQPFGFFAPPVLQFVAQTAGNGLTQNYRTFGPGEQFFKMTTAQLEIDGNKQYLEPTLGLDWSDVPSADPVVAEVGPGVGTLTFSSGPTGLFFTRSPASAPNPDYDAAITLSIMVVDGDGVGAVGNPQSYAVSFSDGANIRYGRMRFTNAFGSEQIDLAVPLVAEYYAGPGLGFVVNNADSCTSNVALSWVSFTENLAAADTCVYDSGAPGSSNLGCAAPGPLGRRFSEPPVAGDFNLWLQAPGLGNTGGVLINAAVPAWLRYDWDATVAGDEDPVGLATFGLFKGHSSQIYLREIY